MFVCMLSGCFAAVPYWVRRSAVHDDWVYDNEEKVLYRRYIPHGVRLPGNNILLEKHGSIDHRNESITVYSSYSEAVLDIADDYIISSESVPFIPSSSLDTQ